MIMRALKHDKKSVAGQINWVLLEGIGRPKIVEGRLISAKSLRLSLRAGLRALERQKDEFPLMQMQRSGERGSASLKFVIVMAILGACAYADTSTFRWRTTRTAFKDLMQHYVDVALQRRAIKPRGWRTN